jgi:putative transposase
VVGDLTGVREKSELGGKNNQKFHALPFRKLTEMIKYKAEEVGITFDTQTEEYTSQTCAFCKPFASKEYANKSNRIHRGLYHCKECDTLVNADVNGSINISKKYLKVLEAQSVVVLGTPKVYTFNGQQFVM